MLSLDRHLLSLEPAVFTKCAFPQQTLGTGTADVAGTTLTAAGADFSACGVKPGHVVVLNDVPYEIVAVPTATTLTVSLVRISESDPPLPLPALTGASFRISTFDPQHADSARVLLARLNLTEAAAEELETRDLLPLACAVCALAAIYRAVSTGTANPNSGVISDDWAALKARWYETSFRTLVRLLRSAPVLVRD